MDGGKDAMSPTSPLCPDTVDIVIVGGGTSGLALAARLTEDTTRHVLVLEAGVDRQNDPRITTPGLVVSLYGDPRYDWSFMSEPQVVSPHFPFLQSSDMCPIAKPQWSLRRSTTGPSLRRLKCYKSRSYGLPFKIRS